MSRQDEQEGKKGRLRTPRFWRRTTEENPGSEGVAGTRADGGKARKDPFHSHLGERIVNTRVFSDGGWITGNIHVQSNSRLIDFLNHSHDFIPVTDVMIRGQNKPVPFFALQRRAIQFLIVVDLTEMESAQKLGVHEQHSVTCLLSRGVVRGDLETRLNVRVSDHISRHGGFIPLMNSHYRVHDPLVHDVTEEEAPAVLVNSEMMIGFTERGR